MSDMWQKASRDCVITNCNDRDVMKFDVIIHVHKFHFSRYLYCRII